MRPPSIAADHASDRQKFIQGAAEVSGQMWSQVNPAKIVESWTAQLPDLAAVVSGAQLGAARTADAYLSDIADAEGVDDFAVASVSPTGFAGQAADGRSLLSLLMSPAFNALQLIAAGLSSRQALDAGGMRLDTIARTEVADAGRAADQAALTAHTGFDGYIRQVVGATCSRCLVLAGRWYKWNTGFQRHPRCDCIHVPASEARAKRLIQDPRALFDRLTSAQRSRAGFSIADQKAIRDGADLIQVVNAKRGVYVAGGQKFTTEGTTRRGLFAKFEVNPETGKLVRRAAAAGPRLTPAQIYKVAGDDRAAAIRLLGENSYLEIGKPRLPLLDNLTPEVRAQVRRTAEDYIDGRISLQQLDDYQRGLAFNVPSAAAPGGGAAGKAAAGPAIRPVLEAARTSGAVERVFRTEFERITGRKPLLVTMPASAATAREVAEGLLRGLERFPEADLREIRTFYTGNGTAYAVADSYRSSIEFSYDWTSVAKRKASLEALAADVAGWDKGVQEFGLGLFKASGFHPRGTGNWTATALHEFGHNLDIATLSQAISRDVDRLIAARTKQAMRRVLPHPETPITGPDDLIMREISGYATTNRKELVAEAFADVMVNGEAASQLSRDIFDLLEAEYKRGGRRVGTSAIITASEPAPQLAKLKVAELRQMAADRGIALPARATKPQILEALRGAETPAERVPGVVHLKPGADMSASTWRADRVEGLTGNSRNLLSAITSYVRQPGFVNTRLRAVLDRSASAWKTWLHEPSIDEMLGRVPFNEAAEAAARERADKMVAAIDDAMERSRTTGPSVVYRGVDVRDIGLPDRAVGHSWIDPGYASTSTDRSVASGSFGGGPGRATLDIHVPTGTPALRIEGLGEGEVLLGRGLEYRVTADRVVDGVRRLEVEVTNRVAGERAAVRDAAAIRDAMVQDRVRTMRIDAPKREQLRMAEVAASKDIATAIAELDELVDNGVSADAIRSRMVSRGAASNLPPELVTALSSVTDRASADAVISRLEAEHKLTRYTPRAGEVQPFSRAEHRMIGGAPQPPEGTLVQVVRPGYEAKIAGKTVRVSDAIVEQLTPKEAAAYRDREVLKLAARERQAAIDVAQKTHDALAGLDELVAKNATKDTLALELGNLTTMKALPAADLTALRRAAGDPAKLRAAIDRISAKRGVTGVTSAGDVTTMREGFDVVGRGTIAPGTEVVVVRRGAEIVHNGETIVLERPQVRLFSATEKAKAREKAISDAQAFLDATPKPTAVQLRKAGVEKVGTVSKTKTVAYDPKTMAVRGGTKVPAGAKVRVVEPGYTTTVRGETVVLRPQVVEPAAVKTTGGIRTQATMRKIYRVDDPETQMRARVEYIEKLPSDAKLYGSPNVETGSAGGWTRVHTGITHRVVDSDGVHNFEVGQLVVDISPDGKTIWHSIGIDEELQGQGFTTRHLAHIFEEYQRLGVKRILLEANNEVGGYAWARVGFHFADDAARQELASYARTYARSVAARRRWSAEALDELERVASSPASEPIDFAMIGHTGGTKMWPGKELLLGSHWRGEMTL